ncbi:MAG: hypothetical protein WDN66_02205 [Candidatus Saccharibacteria bacterium]
MNRYLIGFLACVGLAILLAILLFTGGSGKKSPIIPVKPVTPLTSYANTDAQVRMVVSGPITAPQNFNTGIITVDRNTTSFDLIQGYDGNVINSKIYNNSENSYQNFLYALHYAGFTQSMKAAVPSNIGLCSTGDRYDFYLIENGNNILHTFMTSCSASPRSFAGNFGLVNTLFERQIPDLSTLTANTNF